jgi:ribonuclease VapC
MSVATFVEISMVMESQTGDRGSRQWDQFFRRAGFALEPVNEEQASAARQVWSDFGTGRSPAKRNLGEPLLFKGADLSRTDVSSAI